jgi:hypothetical protein
MCTSQTMQVVNLSKTKFGSQTNCFELITFTRFKLYKETITFLPIIHYKFCHGNYFEMVILFMTPKWESQKFRIWIS